MVQSSSGAISGTISSTTAWALLLGSGLIAPGVAAQVTPLAQAPSPQAEAAVADWFEANRDRPTLLRAFVQRMPKGGDIHTHLSGAVYAEHYLEWAAADGYCIDPAVPALVDPSACGDDSSYFPASELYGRPATYDELLNLWSTRNLPFAGQSGHDQFFEAFGGFDPISSNLSRQDDMVAEVANRAASQQIAYLELLMTVKGSEVRQLGRTVGWSGDLGQMRQQLLDLGLMDLVNQGSQDVTELERQVALTLGCETGQAQPGCGVVVRYLQQTTRTRLPQEVFAQFVYAFELAKANSRVVGINLVAPEDNPVALRDYALQMQMLGFLKDQFPEVNISLHAGELTLGLVPPDDLRFHIRQAVEVAQASRIGHGVAILYEDDPFQLLEEMSRRGVLVEICLTSNEVILNVDGVEHPFLDYWAAGVPMTLASDDEGIARIDLSNEYLLAAQRYDLGYGDLKILARNSLEYSFLGGASLWESPEYSSMTTPCADDIPGSGTLSQDCISFLAESDRARVQWQLESEFTEFESLSSFRLSP